MAELSKNNALEEFEKEYKKTLFNRIEHLCSGQTELLLIIKEHQENLDIKLNYELPNIGITFNNKIIELSHAFEDSGLSMFSQLYENFGHSKCSFISYSFIGDAIISYLINDINKSTNILTSCKNKLDSLNNLEQEKCNAFYSANPIKRSFLIAKSFIKIPPELDFSYSLQDIFELNRYALTYIELDNNIWNCSLHDIMVPSLLAYIKRKNLDKDTIINFFDSSIIPSLEKLGLSDLIPKLQLEISQIYEDTPKNLKQPKSNEDAR